MTDQGCQTCPRNHYSNAGATQCTRCPDGKVSEYGAGSVDECEFGKYCWFLLKGLDLL